MKKLILILLITITLLATLACTDVSILTGINQVRLNNNLNQLVESPELNDFANYRLEKMQIPSHDNFKTDYMFFMYERFIVGNVYSSFFGEIIAYSPIQQSTEAYINAWLNSPSHKETILKNYESFGSASGFVNGNYLAIVEFEILTYNK